MTVAEPMAWPPRDEAALASALADLSRDLAYPATPSIASAVTLRLREGSAKGRRRGRRWALPARSIAFALLALLVLAGAAVAFGIVIGGLRISFAPGTPPPLPSAVVQSRAFGSKVSLDEARRRAGFGVLVPSLAAIGQPEHVYFNGVPSGGTVSLVWGPQPGYPASVTGVGLVVTEFQATVDPAVWEKLLYEGTSVSDTLVNGHAALWISGGEHTFFYRDSSGRRVDSSLQVVGDTLIWQRNGLVLRVEGAPSLSAAAEVARSLR